MGPSSVTEIADRAGRGNAALEESSEDPEWPPYGVGWEPSAVSQY